jgi:hypothetical protein
MFILILLLNQYVPRLFHLLSLMEGVLIFI